jgi:PAS domain-containing protein
MDAPRLGVLLIDSARIFVASNDVAAELLSVPEDELLGRRSDDFMPKVARPIYPLAWQGFLRRGSAAGEYAAERPDGSLQRLAYAGFANRPIRGLHLFVMQALPGEIDWQALVPIKRPDYLQVGLDLPDDVQQRLVREAAREERNLPVWEGAQVAVVAALFDRPEPAFEALDALRALGSTEVSVATAAGATAELPLTLLAGRISYSVVGQALQMVRDRGGRNMGTFDERRTG